MSGHIPGLHSHLPGYAESIRHQEAPRNMAVVRDLEAIQPRTPWSPQTHHPRQESLTLNTNQTMTGTLISFEGSEGCGKSTQIHLLQQHLKARDREVLVLREPGGTELGEEIRKLLQHSKAGTDMDNMAELLLFAASRAQLVNTQIKPALQRGAIVIMDRFTDSTLVYQGIARGLGLELARVVNQIATGGLVPARTFLLDLDVGTAFARITRVTARQLDRIESQPREFFERVREGYLEVARQYPNRIRVIDASQSPEVVHAAILPEFEFLPL